MTASLTGAGRPSRLASAATSPVQIARLAVAALDPVLKHRGLGFRPDEAREQRVEQGLDQPVRATNVIAGEPEDRQRFVAEGGAGIERLLARAQHQLAHRRKAGRLLHRQAEEGGRHQCRRVADELHPLGGADVADDLGRAGARQKVGDLGLAPACRRIDAADREPRSPGRRVAHDDAGLEHHRRDLDHAADGALGPDDLGDDVGGHAVLDPGEKAVVLEVGPDEMARPPGVIGLEHQKHDVERPGEGREIAQMMRPDRDLDGLVRHFDAHPARAHRLDMGRPLVDQDDVMAGPGEVGADRGAIGAGAENRDPSGHARDAP